MRSRSVVLLVVVAVLAGVAAWMSGDRGTSPSTKGVGEPLLPGLAARINDVATLSLQSAAERITVRKAGDRWTVDERGGYPARFDTVKKTLVALSELRTLEPKTSNPDLYARLGVEDPEQSGSNSTLVTLLDAQGQSLGAVIVGRAGSQRETLYARRASDAQSWMVRGTLSLEPRITQWIGTEAFKLPSARIRSVVTAHPDGESLLVSRDAESESNLQLRDVPEGSQPRTSNIARIQHTVLDALNFEDVAAASEHPLGEADVVTATFQTFDGLQVVVTTAPEPAPPAAEGEPTPEPSFWARVEVSALPEATEAVQAEAQVEQERLAPWVFRLAGWKAQNLRKRMADMVSPILPEPGSETEPASPEAEPHDGSHTEPHAEPAPLPPPDEPGEEPPPAAPADPDAGADQP